MPTSDLVRLRPMLDSAREALAFVAGRKQEDLIHDRVLTLALLKCIEIIGEAASKISPEMRAAHSDVPWSDIIGMRNRLIHEYFRVDVRKVWDTVLNLGSTPALHGDLSSWAGMVMAMWFGGRTIEKVARIFRR